MTGPAGPRVSNRIPLGYFLQAFKNGIEVPLHSLLMSLKLIQEFYAEECRPGKTYDLGIIHTVH